MTLSHPAPRFHNHIITGFDVKSGCFAAQPFRNQGQLALVLVKCKRSVSKTYRGSLQSLISGGRNRNRGRKLSTAVDSDKQVIFRIKLQIQPGSAIGITGRRTAAFQTNESYPYRGRKKTPGERCNWETITRSVPLITTMPLSSSSAAVRPQTSNRGCP